jgi:hypothetical protein
MKVSRKDMKVSPKYVKVSLKDIYHDNSTFESGDIGREQENRRLQQNDDGDDDDCNDSSPLLSFHDSINSMIPW